MTKRTAPILALLLLALFFAGTDILAQPVAKSTASRTFSWRGDKFLLDGKPFVIRSGEMHYPRIPRACRAATSTSNRQTARSSSRTSKG